MKHTFTVELIVETDDIVSLLAFEGGGFDYWASISADDADYDVAVHRLMKKLKNKHETICYEDVLANILENSGELTVIDREDGKEFSLTMQMLLNGYKLYFENNHELDSEDMDASDADAILQYALFGELIYG